MRKTFEYKYVSPSAEERKEIEHIRSQFLESKEKTKMDRLRELNRKVHNMPCMIALILGIVGTLIFGLGLTMILEWNLLVWGIVVAAVGCVPMGIAYLVYNTIYNKLKNKYSEEILNLSKELLNDE